MSNRLIAKPSASSPSPGDVIFLDGATGVRGLDAGYPAAAISAHNTAQTAHGFGVYTVAQLNAFTNANRPTGCVYCSDCLAPEGIGSPVVWNGSAWVCTCSGIVPTTDPLTFLRAISDIGSEKGGSVTFLGLPLALGGAAVNGAGAVQTIAGTDPAAVTWTTGTTATGSVRNTSIAGGCTLTATAPARSCAAVLLRRHVSLSASSSGTDEYSARVSMASGVGTALQTHEAGFVYDRGNTLGIGNTGNSGNWFVVTRGSSIGTSTDSGVAPSFGGATQVLEVFLTITGVRFFINGVEIAHPGSNTPPATSTLFWSAHLLKSSGATSINMALRGHSPAVRF